MIGSTWLSRSKKFKCLIDRKWHLIDIHNNGKAQVIDSLVKGAKLA